MTTYIAYIICFILIILSIKSSVQGSLEEKSAKYSLNRLIYYFSIFITFFLIFLNFEGLYLLLLKFITNNPDINILNNNIFKALFLGGVFILIQSIIYIVLKFLNKPLINAYNYILCNGKIKVTVFSSIFGFFKGIVIILIMFMGIIAYNNTIGINREIGLFNNLKGYESLENIVKINKPILNYSDFKNYIESDSNVIVYYNGVTLEEGIKSNEFIDNKAKEIVKNSKNDREKAERIYAWIGSNIHYDFEKAEKALGEEGISNSGAIVAWNTRDGICFDYACLYVAMCRAIELDSRIVTGEAYDGQNYGPHAWNQVYLEDEGVWVNVDTTFYLAGNYFDNYDFDVDHLNAEVVGQWE